jgi:hypothetical protein
MQASAIKHAGLILPSIDGGFGSMNILRDPPKSIFTTFKPKVGDTSRITEWVGESGDRICESINKYARGVNPMVAVSYSNYGTNGGQYRDRSGIADSGMVAGSGQAYLPYRIMRDGAFRPPIIPPQELLPLSRMPRLPTKIQTIPGSEAMIRDFAQFTKCSTDLKALRNELLTVCAPPRVLFNIESPASEPSEVKNMMANKVKAVANSNRNSSVGNAVLIQNTMPERGIRDVVLKGLMATNLSDKNVHINAPMLGNQPMPIQNAMTFECNTNVNGQGNEFQNNRTIQLDRNRPIASASLNPTQRFDLNSTIHSRDYKLPARPSRGGFVYDGFKVTFER